MNLKRKCIYRDTKKGGYYLVLSIKDMIYGIYGELESPNFLDNCMYKSEIGLVFKIDDILINMEYYRNYKHDDKELNNFEFVKELTDEEFYPIKLPSYPNIVIDVHKHMKDVSEIVDKLKSKKEESVKLEKEICELEKELYKAMK